MSSGEPGGSDEGLGAAMQKKSVTSRIWSEVASVAEQKKGIVISKLEANAKAQHILAVVTSPPDENFPAPLTTLVSEKSNKSSEPTSGLRPVAAHL